MKNVDNSKSATPGFDAEVVIEERIGNVDESVKNVHSSKLATWYILSTKEFDYIMVREQVDLLGSVPVKERTKEQK